MAKALVVSAMLALVLAVSQACAAPKAAPAKAAPAKAEAPDAAPDAAVVKAVAEMRKVDVSALPKEEQEAKAKKLTEAWKTLAAAGKAGADALKAEARKIDAAKEKDDIFKLGAGVVLFEIGKLDEADSIAKLWSGDVELAANYNYVFFTALDAARTQDVRAVPILETCLKDKKGRVFIPQHVMWVVWPMTHEFMWTALGPKGLPALCQVLDTSKDETVLESAAEVLARAQYLPALAKLRKLAREGTGAARMGAVRTLGVYGHPDDFELLLAGLKSKDPQEARQFAFALYEYEDVRAVSGLAPLVASDQAALRKEALLGLLHLVTPEGIEVLHQYAAAPKDEKEGKGVEGQVGMLLKQAGLTWETYVAKTPAEKKKVAATLRAKAEEGFRLKPDDKKLSHEDLLKAAEDWKKSGHLAGGDWEWVEDRHALAASTAADIDLWLNVKAKLCLRVSDECIPEMRTVDGLVCRLGRSRYRKEVGITEKAELLAKPAQAKAAP